MAGENDIRKVMGGMIDGLGKEMGNDRAQRRKEREFHTPKKS